MEPVSTSPIFGFNNIRLHVGKDKFKVQANVKALPRFADTWLVAQMILLLLALLSTQGRVHPSNQMRPWKSAHIFKQTSAKPDFLLINSDSIKPNKAKSEYYKTHCNILII